MFGLPKVPWGFLGVASGSDTRPTNTIEDMSALTDAYKAAHLKLPAKVGAGNYAQAQADLQLTPQERSLYERHLTNLNGPGGVDNADGSRSSLYQSVQQHDGKFYNIPTVWNGKREVEPYTKPDGTVMDVPNATALANVEKAGWKNFPAYDTPDEADARYDAMHKYMDKDTAEHMANKGAYANARVNRGWDAFGPQNAAPYATAPMLPTPPTPGPVDMGPPALSPQAVAPAAAAPTAPAVRAPVVPTPQPRPDVPAPTQDMPWWQRNAAMMRDPSTGAFIDPVNAERANSQASGPDVINKLLDMFHKKDT